MSEKEINFEINSAEWLSKGYTVGILRNFVHKGKLEGLLVSVSSENIGKEKILTKVYAEIADIAFSEGYVAFLAEVPDLTSKEVVHVLLIPDTVITNAFAEMYVFELYGLFDLHAKYLKGSLAKLEKTKEQMIKGDIDKSLEFFDILHDVSFIQESISEGLNLNTDIMSLKVLTGILVAFKSDEEKLSIGIDLEQSKQTGVLTKDLNKGSFARLIKPKNILALKLGFHY